MPVIAARNKAQKVFLAVAAVFLVVMAGTLMIRSQQRKSILEGEALDGEQGSFSELSSAGKRGTRLHLQNFHRVEVRDGRPVWEVKARNANYFAQDFVAHVNDPSVIIHRSEQSVVSLKSEAGRLYLKDESILRAELEGKIVVAFEDSVTIYADFAVYNARERHIEAPGAVTVTGKGFEVRGVGADLLIDDQIVKFLDQVNSRFSPEAKPPEASDLATLS